MLLTPSSQHKDTGCNLRSHRVPLPPTAEGKGAPNICSHSASRIIPSTSRSSCPSQVQSLRFLNGHSTQAAVGDSVLSPSLCSFCDSGSVSIDLLFLIAWAQETLHQPALLQ